MSEGIVTASYVGATILFILALGGLSNQETARRGNLYGCLLYTSPSPRDLSTSRMPSSA